MMIMEAAQHRKPIRLKSFRIDDILNHNNNNNNNNHNHRHMNSDNNRSKPTDPDTDSDVEINVTDLDDDTEEDSATILRSSTAEQSGPSSRTALNALITMADETLQKLNTAAAANTEDDNNSSLFAPCRLEQLFKGAAPPSSGTGAIGAALPALLKRRRKHRTAFTNRQILQLERRFARQKYITPGERDAVAQSLSLSSAQVITWFQNRRAKMKREIEEMRADMQATQRQSAIAAGDHQRPPPPPVAGTDTNQSQREERKENATRSDTELGAVEMAAPGGRSR